MEDKPDTITDLRVHHVSTNLLNGNSRKEIVEQYSKEFDVSDRQIDTYIQRAKFLIKTEADKEKEYQFGLALSRLENLYKRNLESGDLRECRQVQELILKLFGLSDQRKIEVNTTIENGTQSIMINGKMLYF